ncbi:MAG: LysR family transcriptional regulator substrate-binding protein, partial [Verrucomicrobia bacterium]|nr:LysR family transcriptional regulator substrate-binding protein [Verrucomicrobiota bacterium]
MYEAGMTCRLNVQGEVSRFVSELRASTGPGRVLRVAPRKNQAGEQLLAEVQPPLAALDAAGESLKRLGKWGQTRLRIGAASSACQHIVPAVIRELKKDFANVTLQVESGDMADMEELVQQGRVDLALGVAPEGAGGLEVKPVFRDELMFVFAPSHPWADGRPISHDDLRRQPLILYQRASYTARQVDDFFRSQNITPSTVLEMGNIEAIKELVKLNLGISVLAPWTADKELVRRKLLMRPLGLRPVRREWVI